MTKERHFDFTKKGTNCMFSSINKKINEMHVSAVPTIYFDMLEYNRPKHRYRS